MNIVGLRTFQPIHFNSFFLVIYRLSIYFNHWDGTDFFGVLEVCKWLRSLSSEANFFQNADWYSASCLPGKRTSYKNIKYTWSSIKEKEITLKGLLSTCSLLQRGLCGYDGAIFTPIMTISIQTNIKQWWDIGWNNKPMLLAPLNFENISARKHLQSIPLKGTYIKHIHTNYLEIY